MLTRRPTKLLIVVWCFLFSGNVYSERFSIVVIPDTQFYTEVQPEIFEAQMHWIRDNRDSENIVYVAHLGDMKDDFACDNRNVTYTPAGATAAVTMTEWQIVDSMLNILDATGIAYSVVPGNHDYEPTLGTCPIMDSELTTAKLTNSAGNDDDFNDIAGPSRFGGKPFYGDPGRSERGNRIPNSNEDNFVLFSHGGIDFIAINLAFSYGSNANDPAITWADGLLQTYQNRLGIITSHYIMDKNPEVGGDYSDCPANPPPGCRTRDCPMPRPTDYNEFGDFGGQLSIQLYDNPNLFMMLSGHEYGEAWLTVDRSADDMRPVQALLQDYQAVNYPADPANADFANLSGSACNNAGNGGFMRIMRFDTNRGFVNVTTFAPAIPALGRNSILISDYFPAINFPNDPGMGMDKDTASNLCFDIPRRGSGECKAEVLLADLDFADENLRSCVLDERRHGGATYVSELTALSCGRGESQATPIITDLTGIDKLTALTSIDISDHQITSLPAEIGNLTGLTRLVLARNQLTSLPAEIGNLTNLTYLNLDGNQLNTLPAEFWNLTAFTHLALNGTQLSSLPPAIGNFTALTSLGLAVNQLTSIPVQIGNLTGLTNLTLDGNQLTSLPAQIGNLTALAHLNLSRNQLTNLPAEIGNLSILRTLYLGDNQLTGLPIQIGNLASLRILHLGNNLLTGLPTQFANLSNLWRLDIYANQLTNWPTAINGLTNLYDINMSANQLTGLPPEIGNLTALYALNFSNNQLTSLPPEIGNLAGLNWLHLRDNQLTGLPQELSNLTNLNYLDLLNNNNIPCSDITNLVSSLGNVVRQPSACVP